MSDLISRSKLIEDIKRRKYIDKPLEEIFETIIDEQPEVEPKRGKWVDNGIPDSMLSKCSVCEFSCGAYSFNFCPNCGADMRKKVEE